LCTERTRVLMLRGTWLPGGWLVRDFFQKGTNSREVEVKGTQCLFNFLHGLRNVDQ
jgi:hypothetical protein